MSNSPRINLRADLQKLDSKSALFQCLSAVEECFLNDDLEEMEHLLLGHRYGVDHIVNAIQTFFRSSSDLPYLIYSFVTYNTELYDINECVFEISYQAGEEKSSMNLLMAAAESNKPDIVDYVLSIPDVDVNKRNHKGSTAILFASFRGNICVLQQLIDFPETDVNLQNDDGLNALLYAACYNHFDTAQMLLKEDFVLINVEDNDATTPLLWSCVHEDPRICLALLEKDEIPVNKRNNMGTSPLLQAANEGFFEMCEALIAQPDIDVNTSDIHGFTPLMCAASKGYNKILDSLLAHPDIQPDMENRFGLSALAAAISMHRDVVATRLILHQRDDENVLNGEFTLHTNVVQDTVSILGGCCRNELTNAVGELLEIPFVRVNAQVGENDRTALMLAVMAGSDVEIVKMLLNCPRLDVNIQDCDGMSALHLAAIIACEASEILPVLQVLLDHAQSDVNLPTYMNEHTPLMLVLSEVADGHVRPICFSEVVAKFLAHPNLDLSLANVKGTTTEQMMRDLSTHGLQRSTA